MRTLGLILFIGVILTAKQACGGGDSFPCRVIGFETESRGDHVITLETDSVGNSMVVHARYHEPWNRWWRKLVHTDNPLVTQEHHREALRMLRAAFESGQSTRFGVMGSGLIPIAGRPRHYQSNALVPLEEPDPQGGTVVYSFYEW